MSSPQDHSDAPAFTALLDAYARWQNFDQTSPRGTLSPSNIPGYVEQANLLAPKSAALAFIITCPYIDVQDIPNDERNRPICTEPYHHLSDRANDHGVKVAQTLPCGLHLCDNCTHAWLNPFANRNNNNCLFNRRVFFPKLAQFQTTEDVQQRLDFTDWFDGVRGRRAR